MNQNDRPAAKPVFEHTVSGIGRFTLHTLDLAQDLTRLYGWLISEHAAFWGMRHYCQDEVATYFQAQAASGHVHCLMGCCNRCPVFLLETYDPARDPVAACYRVAEGDRGMHFLTAPPTQPRHGFTRAVMHTIQAWLFSDPTVQRIVVEPALANQKIHPINRDAGFIYQHQIDLPSKRACLAFCTREDWLCRRRVV